MKHGFALSIFISIQCATGSALAMSEEGHTPEQREDVAFTDDDSERLALKKHSRRDWEYGDETAPKANRGIEQELDFHGIAVVAAFSEFQAEAVASKAIAFRVNNMADVATKGLWDGFKASPGVDEVWRYENEDRCSILFRCRNLCVIVSCFKGKDKQERRAACVALMAKAASKVTAGGHLLIPRYHQISEQFAQGCDLLGGDYEQWRDSFLRMDGKKRQEILAHKSNLQDANALMLILRAWENNETLYRQVLSSFDTLEDIAKNSISPYEPTARTFLMRWQNVVSDKKEAVVPLMFECLWKHPEWKAWRKLAAIGMLKEYGNSLMATTLAGHLLSEQDAEVRNALREFIIQHGDDATLKALIEVERKAEAARACASETRETLEKRIKANAKQDSHQE